jgi:hypothetical protein
VRGKVQEHLQRLDQQERRASAPVKAEPSPGVAPLPLPSSAGIEHVKPEPGESPVDSLTPVPSTSASAGPKSLSALSFAKRKSTQSIAQQDDRRHRRGSTSTRRSSEAPSESRYSSDDDSHSHHRRKNGSKKLSKKNGKARAAYSDSEEGSGEERTRRRKGGEVRKTKKKESAKKGRPSVDYTSSEGEDEEPKKLARVKEEEDDSTTVTASVPPQSASPELVDFSAFRRQKKPLIDDEADTDAMDVDKEDEDNASPVPLQGKLVRGGRKPSLKPKQEIRVPTSFDPFEAGLAGDEEDLYFLKLALERLQLGQDLHPSPPPSDNESSRPPPKHPSGSARTEGFYKITVEEKMANRPASNKAKAAETAKATAAAGTSSVAVSRLARANTRGLVRGMELHKKVTATDTDVLKFNQLKTRKKQLTFSRSGIEGYGLFAVECVLLVLFSLFSPVLTFHSSQVHSPRRHGHRVRRRAHPPTSRRSS